MFKMRNSSTVRPGCFVSFPFVGLSIPVVKRFNIPVNIKYSNIFTAFLLTFGAVASI